jgi:CRISPR/Cas system-associated exonuclease Cas4 (RecB family)
MTTIPEPQHYIPALIDAAHAAVSDKPRLHLGASILGHHCDRWLWLSFRWAVIEQFPGRIRRVFRRGHHEESWIVADLKMIGIEIGSTEGDQTFLKLGGHIGGSTDGIIERGVPEAPNKRHVAEFKTHSKKSWDEVATKGVQLAKPMHFTQMQIYMHGTKIDRALYVAVCKDDDRIYTERVRYDASHAEKALARGQRITTEDRLPPPITTDPTWYQCKFCAGHEFCHSTNCTKEVHCRTCALSTAEADGTWTCTRWGGAVIPAETQYEGCDSHVLHPDLVPWKLTPGEADNEAIYEIHGHHVRNGEGDANVFSSKEILANPEACATEDNLVMKVRSELAGRIQG